MHGNKQLKKIKIKRSEARGIRTPDLKYTLNQWLS
jgi:hypothetical protein